MAREGPTAAIYKLSFVSEQFIYEETLWQQLDTHNHIL